MSLTPPGAGPVLVICDVGAAIGVGHVMRTLALAEELAARGHEVRYVANLDEVPFAADQVRSRGFTQVDPPSDPAGFARLVGESRPHLAVIDSYLLPDDVYAAVRGLVPTVALVDGDPLGRPADLYLDVNIGAEDDTWPLPPGTARLAGLDYAMLRSDVLALRPEDPARLESEPLRLLAFFGGTDAFGAAPVVSRLLAGTGVAFDLTVVAADAEQKSELSAIPLADGQRLEVIEPTARIAELVSGADVVLAAAGSSSWELLSLGAASALVCVAENQRTSYERVAASGTVLGLGHLSALRESSPRAAADLRDLLTDAGLRQRLRATAWSRVDGRGRARVADALGDLMAARGHPRR